MDPIERVNDVLVATIADHRDRHRNLSGYLDTVYDELETLALGGGKRLRPQFCWWGWLAAGGDPASELPIRLGAAVELVHVMALLHDDVIDDADTRRGSPTAHKRLSAHHDAQRLAGESRRYGEGLAVLIGDITSVMSDELTLGIGDRARVVWNELRLEMNLGQFLDTIGSAHRDRDEQFARTVSRLKSAKYTVERPLHLGAVSADPRRGVELTAMLSAYGLPIGEAFQLRDDVLGAFGDSAVVGKPVGGDFREGKPTPMLAIARQRADGAQTAVLDTVGRPDLSDAEVARIQQVIIATGALDAIEQRIGELTEMAIEALDRDQVGVHVHDALVGLARSMSNRSL